MKAMNTVAAALRPGVPLNKSIDSPVMKPKDISCQFLVLKGNRNMNNTYT